MGPHEEPSPRAIPAVAIIHQEGVIGVIALIGLSLRAEGVLGGLAPRGSLAAGVFTGVAVGSLCAADRAGIAEQPASSRPNLNSVAACQISSTLQHLL